MDYLEESLDLVNFNNLEDSVKEQEFSPEPIVSNLNCEEVSTIVVRKCLCSDQKSTNILTTSYHHLGAEETFEKLQLLIEERTRFSVRSGDLRLVKCYYHSQPNQHPCRPAKVAYKPTGEKITCFFKEQSECELHKFTVLAFVCRNNFSKETLECLKSVVWLDILPLLIYPSSRKNARGKVGTKYINCECNSYTVQERITTFNNNTGEEMSRIEDFLIETGGTQTFGCTLASGDPNHCKFRTGTKIEGAGQKKFNLGKPGKPEDNSCLEDFCHSICDIATNLIKQITPTAAENMKIESRKTNSCRLGYDNDKLFSSLSFVSCFVAHAHTDSLDMPMGVTALLSLQDLARQDAQSHILPAYSFEENEEPGIEFFLPDGSFLIESASRENHASSPMLNPDRKNPSRVGIVCFTHKGLQKNNHGYEEYLKVRERNIRLNKS